VPVGGSRKAEYNMDCIAGDSGVGGDAAASRAVSLSISIMSC